MFNSIVTLYGFDSGLTLYINILVVVLGLVVGSFLNVVGLRFLSGESIILPPSKCPKCNAKLKWYDNIPVIAYIFLLGKCRYCKEPISVQYPVVEALTGAIFLLLFLKFGFNIATPLLWILASACVVMCITDFKEQVIFDAISIPMIPIGLIYSFFNLGKADSQNVPVFNFGFSLPETFISSIVGVVLAFLFFEIISLISKLIMKQRAFGEGDTIIAMIFAAWFGWKVAIITIVLSFIVQVICTLPLMLIKLIKAKDKIALISFGVLVCSALIPIVFTYLFNINLILFSTIILLVALIVAIVSAIVFLKRIKELNSYTLLPFGPALILAGFVVLFFFEQLNAIFLL